MSTLIVTNVETQNIKFDSDTTAFTIGSDGGSNVKMANTSTYVSDGGAVTQNTISSMVKSFITVDATGTLSIKVSLNSSSVTDNGSGDHTNNLSNAFESATDFCQTSSGTNGHNYITNLKNDGATITSSAIPVQTRAGNGSLNDSPYAMFAFIGDLA